MATRFTFPELWRPRIAEGGIFPVADGVTGPRVVSCGNAMDVVQSPQGNLSPASLVLEEPGRRRHGREAREQAERPGRMTLRGP